MLSRATKPISGATFPWRPFQRQFRSTTFPVPTGFPTGHHDSTLKRRSAFVITLSVTRFPLEALPPSPEKMTPSPFPSMTLCATTVSWASG